MKHRRIERRLNSTNRQLMRLREELSVNDEQLTVMAEEADELRLRALVSDELLVEREYREASRHVERLCREREATLARISALENKQNTLLDQLGGL